MQKQIGRRPIAGSPNGDLRDDCLPTAQSLPVSPHWEFGISRWQLEKDYIVSAAPERPRKDVEAKIVTNVDNVPNGALPNTQL
jgi:hypothetical protein